MRSELPGHTVGRTVNGLLGGGGGVDGGHETLNNGELHH
jgi:hypothetical protein